MIITDIDTAKVYKISYLTTVNDVPQSTTIKSVERPRPEFLEAWHDLERALYKYFWEYNVFSQTVDQQELKLNVNEIVGVDCVSIKYKNSEAISFTLAGDMVIGPSNNVITYKCKDISVESARFLTETVRGVCIEVAKYADGKRAQGVLFEDEPTGNFENIDPETGEVMRVLPPNTPRRAI